VATSSAMLPLGTAAPAFSLRDVVSGRIYSLDSFSDKTALLVMWFMSNKSWPGLDETTVAPH
jgi:hypothetical protein